MPLLPSGGAHWIEPAGSGAAPTARPTALRDGGVDELQFVAGGVAQYELIDTTNTGVYLLQTAGTFAGFPRLTAMSVGADEIVY